MKDKDWKGSDKLKHMGVCFGVAVVSPEMAVGAAIGKEYGDYKARGNHWCWWDVFWDSVGIIAGSAVHYGVMLAII